MDATNANLEAAKKRLAALDAQITALEPLATEAQPAN